MTAAPIPDSAEAPFGPWNPGISSQVPAHLRHLCTIFRRENTFTDAATAAELRDLTGLDLADLVTFRPERLALHELLIRVTADLSVPDGSRIEDLGINFREIVRTVLARYVAPEMDMIVATFEALKMRLSALIVDELSRFDAESAAEAAVTSRPERRGLRGLFARRPAIAESTAIDPDRERRLISEWEHTARATGDALRGAACAALAKVVSALLVRHGRVWGSREMVATLATDIACNDLGSETIGHELDPLIAKAAAGEGFRVLPPQEQPVVMNTKGPSASGKSTLRPLQKRLAGDIGVRWSEFALISPDIWRKQLLDYATLGPEYKYGGAFTGEELRIIDQKLDRYVARKAERGAISHLLIDRFRFDSFAPDSDEAGSNLLTRFGHTVYLFFMLTPPASLVERAWQRGLDVGRYKAVDDTLAHAIEAYSGMPQVFFTWIERTDKHVHFEFLDNSVALGETPRTVAFGWNDTLNVLDVKGMLDIERYRRIDIGATAPEFLYPDASLLVAARNIGFLRECVDRFRHVNFADQTTGRVYLHVESGHPIWADPEGLRQAAALADTRAGLLAAAPTALDRPPPTPEVLTFLDRGGGPTQTLGAWGDG
jgi:hypothetical protein